MQDELIQLLDSLFEVTHSVDVEKGDIISKAISTLAYQQGYIDGLKEKINPSEIKPDPLWEKYATVIKPITKKDETTPLPSEFVDQFDKFNRERLPNVPSEAYKEENGKIIIDQDKLGKINDEKNSYGFRCPSCHQSFALLFADGTTGLIRDLDTPLTIGYFKDVKNVIGIMKKKSKRRNYEAAIKFFNDIQKMNELFGSYRIESVALEKESKQIGICPICGETHHMNDWITAFDDAKFLIEFERPCPICGSEMRSSTLAEGEDKKNMSYKTVLKCDNTDCNYSVSVHKHKVSEIIR